MKLVPNRILRTEKKTFFRFRSIRPKKSVFCPLIGLRKLYYQKLDDFEHFDLENGKKKPARLDFGGRVW